jgi:hypothetical protein
VVLTRSHRLIATSKRFQGNHLRNLCYQFRKVKIEVSALTEGHFWPVFEHPE